jgi:alkanesulfonate monooxygenase SsuD/methylene tetrahydromethanopterin reductase-like flavin-dependent oxidoreductase (luciferase family)
VPIFARTPVAMAQAAATIDEFSGGRMVLGLGVSHQVTVENWYGARIEKPVTQMREYVGIVRAILRGEAPPQGEFFNTRFQFMGYEPRPELPIYVAALSPNMLRLAGEIADGVMLWLCNPGYIREVVVPEVTEGRQRAGKALDGFDVVAAVPVALTDDPDAARATMRQDLITYASLPFYRSMLERSGFGDEIAAFDEGMQAGDLDRAKAGLSDQMLGALAGVGSAEEVTATVQRYREAGAISPCVGGMRGTDFDGALEAVAELI